MSGLDGAKAFVAKNKVVLGIGGAAAVAGLALVQSKGKAKSSSSSSGAPTIAGNGAATGAAGVYDSSSSDVYNALQPALEGVSNQYDSLMEWLRSNGGVSTSTPTPVPGVDTPAVSAPTTPDASPRLDKITTDWGSSSGSIYNAVLSDGRSVAINQNAVQSGAFGGNSWGSGVAGYNASESDQIREALAAKGLGYGRAGNTGGGYTEATAGGGVLQPLGGWSK